MRRASIEEEEFWRFVLSEQSGSVQSVREFCRQEDVSEASFYQWRKKLGLTPESASPEFLPIKVVPSSLEQLDAAKDRTTNVILPKSDSVRPQSLRGAEAVLTDASLPIDNNETEQLMKQVAIGRKNWLFAGSLAAGERSAGFMTLVSSALRNDLDVWQYLKDIFDQLLSSVTDYGPLLPWNWAAKHPEAVRQYRVRERRERTDRKEFKRDQRRKKKSS